MNEDYLPEIIQKETDYVKPEKDNKIRYFYVEPVLKNNTKLVVKKNFNKQNDLTCDSLDDNYPIQSIEIEAKDYPGRMFKNIYHNYYISIKEGNKYIWEFVRKG
jgi:hypothetical protein